MHAHHTYIQACAYIHHGTGSAFSIEKGMGQSHHGFFRCELNPNWFVFASTAATTTTTTDVVVKVGKGIGITRNQLCRKSRHKIFDAVHHSISFFRLNGFKDVHFSFIGRESKETISFPFLVISAFISIVIITIVVVVAARGERIGNVINLQQRYRPRCDSSRHATTHGGPLQLWWRRRFGIANTWSQQHGDTATNPILLFLGGWLMIDQGKSNI